MNTKIEINQISDETLDGVVGGNLFGSILQKVFGPGARHPVASTTAYVAVAGPWGALVNPVADLAYRLFG